jgi:pyridoxal phosphate enzyme (YggS family)
MATNTGFINCFLIFLGGDAIMNIMERMQEITANIEKARVSSPIAAKDITLLAASKTQPAPVIEQAIEAGITDFGENRVQEAREKWPGLKIKYPHIKLHLIGPLQTNKVRQALSLFDVIQTIDRPELAEAIGFELKKNGLELGVPSAEKEKYTQSSALKTYSFYIQVNTGKEPQKAGVSPENADEFINLCKGLGLPVAGLMCVPPVDQPPAPHFALLRQIAMRNRLSGLSMGMSGDFEEAVRMGSSCVRVGTALFGERV